MSRPVLRGGSGRKAAPLPDRVVGISYPGGATNSFAYNGDDMRMQKVDSAGTANYVCDGTTPASSVLSDSSAIYTPGLSERRSSTSKFYHGDNLGSTRGITNSSQTVTDAILYDAFGNTLSRTGTTPTPFGFVGKGQYQTDNDSGLMLLGNRYYDASVGRFLSSDPAKAGDNWYAYCDNNPLKQVDPKGECPWLLLVAVCIIVIIATQHGDGISRDPLPPGATGPTPIEAAGNAMKLVAADGREHGGWIYSAPGGGYIAPDTGRPIMVNGSPGLQLDWPQFGYEPVGRWHTHPPGYSDGSDYGDQNVADTEGITQYAADPNGDIIVNTPRPDHKGDPYPNDPHASYNGPGVTIGGRWK